MSGLIGAQLSMVNVDTSYWVKKGDVVPNPVFTNEITIVNSAGESSVQILENADGETVILNSGNDIAILPNTGNVVITCDSTNETPAGLFILPEDDQVGLGFMRIHNGTESVQYDFSVASITSEGRTADQLQIFGKSNISGVTSQVLNMNVEGSELLIGDPSIVGGAVVSVNGSSGASRVFDTLYNPIPRQVSSNFGNYISSGNQLSRVLGGNFGTIPQGNIFQAISQDFSFPILTSGRYMFQFKAGNGLGSSLLNIGATPNTQGFFFSLRDRSQLPPLQLTNTFISASYLQVQNMGVENIGPGGNPVIVNLMIELTQGMDIEMLFDAAGTPINGLLEIELIQMC